MKYKSFLLIFILFVSFANAKEYSLKLLLDNSSNKYLEEIKNETRLLFSSSDKIDYKVRVCSENCEELISSHDFIILNKNQKLEENKNSYIITYNFLNSLFDENRVIRVSALGIYEYLIENKKTESIYFKNKKNEIFDDKKPNSTNDKKLALNDVFSLALDNNFDIKYRKNSSKIDKLYIDESISDYKPQLEFYSNLIQIDKDRAKYSSGMYSEGTVEAGVKLTQVIYSDKILKNIEIKRLLELSNTNARKSSDDETLYKILLTYLNIIKANNYNNIMKIKQNFIKQNLEFSKQRVEVGLKDRSDVYRWESELANVNIQLANSKNELNSLKIELANQLQIENNFSFIEYGMASNIFKLLNSDAIKYISNKSVQELFFNDIIYKHSKLKQINELINMKNKELKMNNSSRYLPTIAFEGKANKIIERYGVDDPYNNKYWDDNEYEAVINLSLPLYEGGKKTINIQKDELELVNLKLQYNNVKSLIEKSIQQDYESLLKSYEKISYSKKSLEFSKKSYDLIQDRYKNGSENIISLLDAQNSYIVSKLNENISVIDYLVDLSSIYFFIGKIDILSNKDKKMEFEEKILNAIKG